MMAPKEKNVSSPPFFLLPFFVCDDVLLDESDSCAKKQKQKKKRKSFSLSSSTLSIGPLKEESKFPFLNILFQIRHAEKMTPTTTELFLAWARYIWQWRKDTCERRSRTKRIEQNESDRRSRTKSKGEPRLNTGCTIPSPPPPPLIVRTCILKIQDVAVICRFHSCCSILVRVLSFILFFRELRSRFSRWVYDPPNVRVGSRGRCHKNKEKEK